LFLFASLECSVKVTFAMSVKCYSTGTVYVTFGCSRASWSNRRSMRSERSFSIIHHCLEWYARTAYSQQCGIYWIKHFFSGWFQASHSRNSCNDCQWITWCLIDVRLTATDDEHDGLWSQDAETPG